MRGDIKEIINFLGKEAYPMFNKSELAKRYNCDPRTIDRYIKLANGELEQKSTTRKYTSKLDPYKAVIIDKVDNFGCSAMGVFKFIEKKGYTGKYSIVADFVRKHKSDERKKATLRFETQPGLQAQVDWKENLTLVNRKGEPLTINIFLMVLGYSRYKYLMISSDRNQDVNVNIKMHKSSEMEMHFFRG